MMTSIELEHLCGIMQRYGLTKLVFGDVSLERPDFTVVVGAEKPSDEELEEEDELTKIQHMSPDAIDRMLALSPTGTK